MEQPINKDNIVHINPDDLSRNLKKLIIESDRKASDLARDLDIPYNTVKRLVSGYTTDPRISTLSSIADYFNVSLDMLIGKKEPSAFNNNKFNSPLTVPIFNWSDISNKNFFENVNLKSWPNWHPIALVETESLSNHAYAIESRQSMQPRLPSGTLLVIEPTIDPIDGDLVLIRLKRNDEVSLRELVIDPPKWQLLPISKNSDIMSLDKKEHDIIGVVVMTLLYKRRL